jgi:Ras GTPase-activating-like protein IQGAP2/3
MSTTSSGFTRGRSFRPAAQSQSSFDMDVNNTFTHPSSSPSSPSSYKPPTSSTRNQSPSPTRRSPYLRQQYSPDNSPPRPGLSRSGSTYSHHHHPPLSPSSLGDVKKLNRSSVLHLRNLSELSIHDDVVYGLGIPEMETDEVTGLAGRKRLARGESQKVYAGGKLWVDKQRQVIQTYEYLCHVGEAKQ